jgi:hypothetical protein
MARYWVGTTIANRMGTKFPYGTFVINITACMIIGFSLTVPGQTSGLKSRLEVPGASWLYWRLQHLFDLRVGDSFHDSNRRFLTCRPLCDQQSHSWACCRVGRLSDCGDPLMRTQKQLVFYQSILEVLQESGCPFCRFLKEYQAARLQHHSEHDIHHLCNFHTWGLAAVQNALTAAEVFIHLVDDPAPIASDASPVTFARKLLRRRTGGFANSSAASIGQTCPIGCERLRCCASRTG